jgi:hypothetical protein
MWAVILAVFHSTIFQAGIYGAGAAAAVDYHAFVTWKSVADVKAYNWGTAIFRWVQGFITATIMAGVKTAGVAALAPAAMMIGAVWIAPSRTIRTSTKSFLLIGLLTIGMMSLAGCAGNVSQQVEQLTRDATKKSETLHNAPAPSPSLTDAQFRQVNAVLLGVSQTNQALTTALAPCAAGQTSTAAAPCGVTGTAVLPLEQALLSKVQSALTALAAMAPGVVLADITSDLTSAVAKITAALGR